VRREDDTCQQREEGKTSRDGGRYTQFTCFTGTGVPIPTRRRSSRAGGVEGERRGGGGTSGGSLSLRLTYADVCWRVLTCALCRDGGVEGERGGSGTSGVSLSFVPLRLMAELQVLLVCMGP
jgi:hypothetical protein